MFDIPEPIEPLEVEQDTLNLDTASDEIIVKTSGRKHIIYGIRELKRWMGAAMREGVSFTAYRTREPEYIICAVWQEPARRHCYIEQSFTDTHSTRSNRCVEPEGK